jgi:hypothetical protein
MIELKIPNWFPISCAATALLVFTWSRVPAQILSSKRGLADNATTYDHLQATGASWYYTWGTSPDNPGNFDATHYPMFWNAPSQSTIDNVKSRNPSNVLGFNEPERSDQANMTVDQALASWSTISNSFAGTTTKFISPGVSDTVDSGNTIGGRTWLSNFMTELNARKTDPQNPDYNPNLRIDAVAFHWYGASTPNDPAGAASSFLGSVDLYHNTYGLPVYITEFAIHDWGNVYTDAQIIEANREFLNIVIPALESRSYVAGYSWFGYFSDSALYSGSPPTPTPMSYSYIGAVSAGQVANIGGQNLGEHVAYLTGGELTMTGTPGTIRYINALANQSTISGGLDWGLNAASNWVRIQPGATLSKGGSDQITLGGGTVTNNGVLEVAQGSLQLGVSVAGNGSARVTGGTLALTGSGKLDSAPLVDIQAAGTLDVSSAMGTYTVTSGQNLNNDGTLIGNATAAAGATVSGGGAFSGDLIAQAGSIVRVGKDGSGVPRRFVIDDFESYALGDVRSVASPPWTAHQDTTLADIESYNGDKVLTFGSSVSNNFIGVSRNLPNATVIDNNTTATLFFRVNSKTGTPNHSIGLGDQASTATVDFGDYETQLRVKQGSTASTIALDARNGGSFTATLANNLALNTWYNIWMVVNQTTDKYDIYMNTGTNAATSANKLNATPLSFRNGTTSDLNKILAMAGSAPVDNGVRLDDFVFLSGIDLTNPAAGFDPGLVWTPETLTVNGNYAQSTGATLQLNLLDPSHRDVLHVIGNASFGGTLNISFAVGAPAPQLGDVFDVLDFGSTSGAFASLSLPALPTGLGWDTSNLLTTGTLRVGLLGDYNANGIVDAADYVTWRKGLGAIYTQSDYDIWRAHYGQTAGSGSGVSANAAVPEPATLVLLMIVAAGWCLRRRRAA